MAATPEELEALELQFFLKLDRIADHFPDVYRTHDRRTRAGRIWQKFERHANEALWHGLVASKPHRDDERFMTEQYAYFFQVGVWLREVLIRLGNLSPEWQPLPLSRRLLGEESPEDNALHALMERVRVSFYRWVDQRGQVDPRWERAR